MKTNYQKMKTVVIAIPLLSAAIALSIYAIPEQYFSNLTNWIDSGRSNNQAIMMAGAIILGFNMVIFAIGKLSGKKENEFTVTRNIRARKNRLKRVASRQLHFK